MKILVFLLALIAGVQGGLAAQQPSLHISNFDTEDPCLVGTTTIYVFEIRNEGRNNAADITLSCQIPAEMVLVKAQGPTPFQKMADGKIQFAPVANLAVRSVLVYKISCLAKRPGFIKFRAWVSWQGLPAPILREEATNIVEGRTKIPALHVSCYDTEDPCYLTDYNDKGQTVYVIGLRNEGTAPLQDIVVKNRIAAEMKFLQGKGPCSYQVHGDTVVFEKIPALAPGKKWTFLLTCQANKLGVAKNSVIVELERYQLTLTNEESTTINEYRPFRDYGYLQTQIFEIGANNQFVEDSCSSGESSIGGVTSFYLKYPYQGHKNPYFQLRTSLAPQNQIELVSEYFADKTLKTLLAQKKVRIPEWQPTTILLEGEGKPLYRYLRLVPRMKEEENPRDIADILLHMEKFYFLNMQTSKLLAVAGATGQRISINIPDEGLFEISLQQFPWAHRTGIVCNNEISLYRYENMKTPSYKIIATNNIVGNHKYWVWVKKTKARPDVGVMIQAKVR